MASTDRYATASGNSVSANGVAGLLAASLLANMDKDVSHFHGQTAGNMQRDLAMKETMVAAEQAVGNARFSYAQADAGPEGIAHSAAVEQATEMVRG